MSRILAIDDEPAAISLYREALGATGHEVVGAGTAKAGLALAKEGGFETVLLDYQLPDGDGIDLIPELVASLGDVPVIMVTSHGSTSRAVRAIRQGAYDFIEKPFSIDVLRVSVSNAISFCRLACREEYQRSAALGKYRGAKDPFAHLPPETAETLRKAAPTKATILLAGETGVGKEHTAARIHQASGREKAAFVAINCAAIPATLAESELFGHERGAFTGANESRPGKFEIADGGTLFLDEIGELPLDLQPKLLRVLQESEVTRVGARRSRKVDVRILAATNRDLEKEVQAGRFRQDLFFRLDVVSVRIPSLRERREAIPELANEFLRRTAAELGRKITGFTPEALALLTRHSFPGNVRELSNAIERAVIMEDGTLITARSLALGPASSSAPSAPAMETDFRTARDDFEREFFSTLLKRVSGNQAEAARLAGLHRNNLRAHLVRLGLAAASE